MYMYIRKSTPRVTFRLDKKEKKKGRRTKRIERKDIRKFS